MDKQFKDFYKNLRKAAEENWEVDETLDIKDNNAADDLDGKLAAESENTYMEIAKDIVSTSQMQLKDQNESKNTLKDKFTTFFIWFVCTQYLILTLLLFFKGFCEDFYLADGIIVTYISSVFVETLGAIVIMIKYAFDSNQEVKILQILNDVISNYKKFNSK